MESLTKRRLDRAQIDAAVTRAFGPDAVVIAVDELSDGMFNAVYRLTVESGSANTGDGPALTVLKSSPPRHVPLLTYERDILRTEAAFYELASTAAGVVVPRVLARDFSRREIDGDLLFVSHLDGVGWRHMHDRLGPHDRSRLRHDLGAMAARLHQVTGVEFGYFQPGAAQASTWQAAFLRMIDDVLADAERFAVRLPFDAATVRRAIGRHAPLLDRVTVPALVHFDLWDGNILLAEQGGQIEISGLIDGERAMWADPVADFVSAALFADIARDDDFLAGYGEATGKPFVITPEIRLRLAMYKIYLDLVIVVEAVPRGYDLVAEHTDVLRWACDDLRAALDVLGENLKVS